MHMLTKVFLACSRMFLFLITPILAVCLLAPDLSAQDPTVAQFTNPANGATNVDPAVNFTWTNVLDAQVYEIYLSTIQPGGTDAWQSDELPNISSLAEMTVIPNTLYYYSYRTFTPPSLNPQTTYYARLWTDIANTWYYVDSNFTTGYGIARLTSSANWDGAGGVGPTTTFTWNAIADATAPTPYYLYVGTQPNQLSGGVCSSANACVWQIGPISATSATIPTGLLQPNTPYYVRLYTEKNSEWLLYADSAFSTGSFNSSSATISQIIYPVNGATNVNPFGPVQWTTVPLVTGSEGQNGYFLYIGDGTSPQTLGDYVFTGQTPRTAWEGGLVGGKTYYATLYTFAASGSGTCENGCWDAAATVTFTTAAVATPPSASVFYANVATATATARNMATGEYSTPGYDVALAHTFLHNNLQTATNGVAFCSDFANNLMVQLIEQGIIAHRRDSVFGAGPPAHSVVEYWDPFLGKWAATDATFGMMFYDPIKDPATMGMGEIANALMQGNQASIPNTYVTSASITPGCTECFGSYWDMNYISWDMHSISDPILDYLNPLSTNIQYLELSEQNNPTGFMLSISNPAGLAAAYVFSFVHATDSVLIQNGTSQVTVVPQPTSAPVGKPLNYGNFSNAITLTSGWSYVGTPPTGMTVKRLTCPMYQGPQCPD